MSKIVLAGHKKVNIDCGGKGEPFFLIFILTKTFVTDCLKIQKIEKTMCGGQMSQNVFKNGVTVALA